MNSICNSNINKSSINSKAKAVAIKYEKYCEKKQLEKHNSKFQCLFSSAKKIDVILRKGWNMLIPKLIRGPVTPYEQLMIDISQIKPKTQLQNLPFTKSTITQVPKPITKTTQKNRVKIILTYTKSTLQQTLQRVGNNQQINTLINKKAEIIPICIYEEKVNKISIMLKQLVDRNGPGLPYQEQIFVLWKGLFEEIIVIGQFQLHDVDLCWKIFSVVQDREDYQDTVRKIVARNREMNQQSSLNKLEEQSTGIDKEPEN